MSDHVKVMMTMRSLGRIILALTHALFAVTSFTFIPVSSRKRYESTLFALRTMSSRIQIQQHVGSGSYGTVYLCNYTDDHGVHHKCIAKRAWNFDEMACLHPEAEKKVLIDKAKRADYYLSVEEHCLTKARDRSTSTHHIPTFLSTFDDAHYKWIVMNQISRKAENITNSPLEETAKSLKQVMDSDWIDQHSTGNRQSHHHLYMIQKELNLPQNSTFADTLDTVLLQLFHCVKDIHSINIVHRDLKPENLLVDGMRQSFVLIDFGSAADLDLTTQSMFGFNMIKKRIGLEDDSVVALSPIYAAPEQFVKVDRYVTSTPMDGNLSSLNLPLTILNVKIRNPLSFDVFSIAMIFCQLLFNLLDERADAAFRQQLHESNYDLDTWIARELTTTIRPVGLEDALLYLDERRGRISMSV
jgi:serine/threonine protein kinase